MELARRTLVGRECGVDLVRQRSAGGRHAAIRAGTFREGLLEEVGRQPIVARKGDVQSALEVFGLTDEVNAVRSGLRIVGRRMLAAGNAARNARTQAKRNSGCSAEWRRELPNIGRPLSDDGTVAHRWQSRRGCRSRSRRTTRSWEEGRAGQSSIAFTGERFRATAGPLSRI